jgi:hypothetical protein
MIAHIVLFTPKTALTPTERLAFAQAVLDVTGSVSSIKRASVGRRIEVDPGYARSFGDVTYEYAAVLEFADREALLAYLQDPKHQELGRLFWDSCERSIVTEVEFVSGSDPSSASKLAL